MAIFLCQTAANFGTLARSNALGDMEVPEELTESLWCDIITSVAGFPFWFSFRNGDIVECRQDLIPKSAYQSHIETGSTLSEESPQDSGSHLIQGAGDIRYWSDFDRVYYLPRSLQKLPDPPEWKSTNLGWNEGHEMFTRHNEVYMNVGYQMAWIDMDVIGSRTSWWICSSLCWRLRIDTGNQLLTVYFLLNYRRLICAGLSNHEWCRCLRKFYECLYHHIARRIPKVGISYIPCYVK